MVPARGNAAASRVRLGELLVKAGVITDAQLRTALQEQKQWGGKLGDILVRMRYVSEDVFVRALSKQLGLPRADLSQPISLEALAKVPADLAEEYEIIPVALLDDGKTLAIATSDPLNLTVIDYVRGVAKVRVAAQVAGASAIRAAIARLYQGDELRGEGGSGGPLRVLSNSEDAAPGGTPTRPALDAPAAPSFVPRTTPSPGLLPAMVLPVPPATSTLPPGPERYSVIEESQRREVAALKALVELLVQKGYISLDEYLARLKR